MQTHELHIAMQNVGVRRSPQSIEAYREGRKGVEPGAEPGAVTTAT